MLISSLYYISGSTGQCSVVAEKSSSQQWHAQTLLGATEKMKKWHHLHLMQGHFLTQLLRSFLVCTRKCKTMNSLEERLPVSLWFIMPKLQRCIKDSSWREIGEAVGRSYEERLFLFHVWPFKTSLNTSAFRCGPSPRLFEAYWGPKFHVFAWRLLC